MTRLIDTRCATAYTHLTAGRLHQLATDGKLTRHGTAKRRMWDLAELSQHIRPQERCAA